MQSVRDLLIQYYLLLIVGHENVDTPGRSEGLKFEIVLFRIVLQETLLHYCTARTNEHSFVQR